jgi:phage tail tape-measure protein
MKAKKPTKAKPKTADAEAGDAKETHHLAHEAEGVASGAVAGVAIGAAAGPPGMIAGAVIGAVAGAIAASALENEADRQAAHTRELDEEIGVTSSEIGAPNLKHPAATSPSYSVTSSGAHAESDDDEPAEGPIPTPKS